MTLIDRCTHAFGVPDSESLLDFINPDTGRSLINNSTLEEIQQRAPGAAVVLISDHLAAKAARQEEPITWAEVTEARYDEMLNVLPPAAWESGKFLVGEPWDHHAISGAPRCQCFAAHAGRYYVASRPMTRAEFRAINPATLNA